MQAAVASVSLAFLGSLRLLHRLPLQAVASQAASSLIAACRAAYAYLQQHSGHSSQGPSLEPKGALHDTGIDADSPGDAALQKRLLKHVKVCAVPRRFWPSYNAAYALMHLTASTGIADWHADEAKEQHDCTQGCCQSVACLRP